MHATAGFSLSCSARECCGSRRSYEQPPASVVAVSVFLSHGVARACGLRRSQTCCDAVLFFVEEAMPWKDVCPRRRLAG